MNESHTVARTCRLHRSDLAVPATSERFFRKAADSAVDALFLDLEDAIAPDKKEEARKTAIQALNEIDWGRKIVSVRVNALDTRWGYRDILELAEQCPRLDMILLPKAGSASDIEFVDTLLTSIERAKDRRKAIGIQALIESARGMVNAAEIARASPRMEALVFGVGDYMIDMHTSDLHMGGLNPDYSVLARPRSAAAEDEFFGDQWHYALSRVATVCRAYGLRPIDGPFTNFKDAEGYKKAAARARALGYEGKWAIHPSQIELANDAFSPAPEQVRWARRADEAMKIAFAQGKGAINLDGELFDVAHTKLASNILKRAQLIEDALQNPEAGRHG
jgi:malyl-CoA/(S)-citramalyl-CoA lyase